MGVHEKQSIKGQVQLVLKDSTTGRVIEERVVRNTIMAGGSELVARLFCGEGASQPISHVGVGTSDEEAGVATLTDLKSPVASSEDEPDNANLVPIGFAGGETGYVSPDAATGSARVKFAATFDEGHGNGALMEAGIFNNDTGGVLYNRVTFPVINKADNHTLTLVWEITFSGAS